MAKKNKTRKTNNKRQIPDIVISQHAVDVIRSESSKSGTSETGGLLLGEKKLVNGNYVIIVHVATGPGPNAKTGAHYYITDNDFMKKQLKKYLNEKALVYCGEWHKHPEGMSSPSMQDQVAMQERVDEKITMDVLTVIATEDHKTLPDESLIQYNCFYFQKGMKAFEKIGHKVRADNKSVRNLKIKKRIGKINLDIEYPEMMFAKKMKTLEISGQLLKSGIANFFINREGLDVKARILYKRTKNIDIDFNRIDADLFIIIRRRNKRFSAKAWTLNSSSGEFEELEIEILNLGDQIYKRLAGLDLTKGLNLKTVTLVGVGSVGSAAAVQLAKAGISKINLIDPDSLELHNICRHACDMADLGRPKVEGVRDRLLNINPNAGVNALQLDVIEDIGNIESILSGSDLIIASTDTPDSRMAVNMIGVENNTPMIFISLHERARSGKVERFIPGITQCRACMPGRSEEFLPGSTEYTGNTEIRDIIFQPGLDTDISIVTLLGVKSALNLLALDSPDKSNIFDSDIIYWNGYQSDGEPALRYASGLRPNPDCDICSFVPEESRKVVEAKTNFMGAILSMLKL